MRCAIETVVELPSHVAPNPLVGCVIVKDGKIIGRGSTHPPGGNHAEIEALEDAARNGHDVKGATVYVTLEPCCHHGRTAPCTDALIRAGVSNVVAAMTDPDPRVSGEGFARLMAAGIDVLSGVLESEARELNLGFLSRVERGRPWVRMKVAASLDGKTALLNGQSQWITSEAARHDGHLWRARADAILTGMGTVRHDDPSLTVRAVDVPRQPRRVVVDSRLRIEPDAKVLSGGGTWIFCAVPKQQKVEELLPTGAEIITMSDKNWAVDLPGMMQELGRREINEVHVEAGAVLNGALLRDGCVDELLVYMAPSVIGEGRGMFSMMALESLGDIARFRFHDVTMVGPDLRITARIETT
ncbi:bifunctional diaminohydroxyphosphoribosylaminopyrimidine deaminase/5-amino-6-(5-phosphoribosylamino)uracil reductase RibD [Oxalobacter sp. OttesenSCG-928-P03]|nr:bifunctional diaminohydroxyphosphoribosylaminopyrimidine deaminase/5-amino-6-(5-phosphoribosylamino)uracil reductase RibD [Oxalobacter sp. OttesenSCG-928-P03]